MKKLRDELPNISKLEDAIMVKLMLKRFGLYSPED